MTTVLVVLTSPWRPAGFWASNLLFAILLWFFFLILVLEVADAVVMMGKFRSGRRNVTGGPSQYPCTACVLTRVTMLRHRGRVRVHEGMARGD